MSKKAKHESATPATEWLRAHGVSFNEGSYDWVEHGGTQQVADEFGLDHHTVIKTLIMETEARKPLVVLMHGDCEVSVKNLARQIGCKSVAPCRPDQAQRNSGYQVGGTSPFGTRRQMPVYAEETIFDLPLIYINGGRRGYQVSFPGAVLRDVLGAKPVHVALPKSGR